jgi:hypothetical protein
MNNKLFFTLTILGTFLMTLILFTQNQVVDAEHQEQTTSSSDVNQSAISQLKSYLTDTDSDIARENLESKIQQLEYKQQVQSAAMAQPQKSLEQICKSIMDENLSSPKQIQDEKPAGIVTVREDFLVTQGYRINNMWRGYYNGYYMELYSGNEMSEENMGIVILSIPEVKLFNVFTDPLPKGGLTILDINNYQVQLSTVDGTHVYFDIPSQQFTNDLAKNLSIVDLPPLPTPITDPCAEYYSP